MYIRWMEQWHRLDVLLFNDACRWQHQQRADDVYQGRVGSQHHTSQQIDWRRIRIGWLCATAIGLVRTLDLELVVPHTNTSEHAITYVGH